MSVNELQALTQQFADAFDQRDLKTCLAMLCRTTLVFIKQGGQWKIVSAHFSAIPQAL
jgi:ketosteroid isomerase-like protein